MDFDIMNLEMLQTLSFPIIEKLTGFNPSDWTGEKGELFINVGEAFQDVSELFIIIGSALEDGKLSMDEIKDIIEKASDLPTAIEEIVSFFEDDDPVEGNNEEDIGV